LTTLRIDYCPGIADYSPLARARRLRELDASGTELRNASTFSKLTQVTSLSLASSANLLDLADLDELTNLERLDLAACPMIDDLSPLSTLKRLRCLDISDCEQITDFSPLAELQSLESLKASFVPLIDLGFARSLPKLSELEVSRTLVRTLEPLRNSRSLQMLDVQAANDLTDISALGTCPSLRLLNIAFCDGVSDEPLLRDLVSRDVSIILGDSAREALLEQRLEQWRLQMNPTRE
jgi:internalin A